VPVFSKQIAPDTDFTKEQGFICNKGNHWFAVRKVNNVWYNLNSTNMTPPGPQYITDFLLSAFFATLKDEGFTIFTVRGQKLPDPNPMQFAGMLRKNQHYVDANEIRVHYEQNKGRKLNF
jgi:hypothetical protein